MSVHQFLLEVLCEEIPANALPAMRAQLAEGFRAAVQEARLGAPEVQVLSTVRRVAVHLSGLLERQPDREETVSGPPVRAAYGADGSPTKAALGFARGQGVAVEALRVVEGPKGEVVAVTKAVKGRPAVEILAEAIPEIFAKLHFPKVMRWGSGDHAFVRPVHNVVALFGGDSLDEVVPVELFAVRAGTGTVGHRVIAPGRVELRGVRDLAGYLDRTEAAGVVVDQNRRRERLEERASGLAREVDCAVRPDPELVVEHVELVEFPGVLRGRIADRFLELPEEVLVTTLRHHQKCLVLERGGAVAPYFLAVCDRPDDPEGHVATGNEWVAGARLTDAAFFFAQDRRKPLAVHATGLERVTFHQRAGSYAAKAEAVIQLADELLELNGTPEWSDAVVRAAQLAKADLVTAMVGEFPELQGVVGGIYARLDGEGEAVWQAIYDQYRPAGLDGPLPRGAVGAIVGVADRLDTLAALFVAGEVPTGSKDPFALRRAALAAVRIAGEAPLALDLSAAVERAVRVRRGGADEGGALLAFVQERVRYYLTAVAGVGADVADAVLAARWGVVPDDVARALALQTMRSEPAFADLAVAFKRVRNIVAKAEAAEPAPERLGEPAERDLLVALGAAEDAVSAASAAGDQAAGLRALAALAAPLDRFFTEVLVLCEDPGLRRARLALLRQLEALFLRLADLSRLAAPTS